MSADHPRRGPMVVLSTRAANGDGRKQRVLGRKRVQLPSPPIRTSTRRLLLRDRDGRFAVGEGAFGKALGEAGITTMKAQRRSPDLSPQVTGMDLTSRSARSEDGRGTRGSTGLPTRFRPDPQRTECLRDRGHCGRERDVERVVRAVWRGRSEGPESG